MNSRSNPNSDSTLVLWLTRYDIMGMDTLYSSPKEHKEHKDSLDKHVLFNHVTRFVYANTLFIPQHLSTLGTAL